MANKTLFASIKSILPRSNVVNEAGGRAYKLTPKQALAQVAATGCFNGTFYASGESQLFLAKLAV
jgi:60 kDa SS-A/Ro ribonucleoprotein